jgi:hypothetical protein
VITFCVYTRNDLYLDFEIQIIMRLYQSPAEIIYGFDVDCCGILYDGEKFYCTERGKYSHDNKINHFDIDRMSKSYCYRMAKYKSRLF